MTNHATESSGSLLEALRSRRGEIEAAILTRLRSDGAPTENLDPEYGEGLRAAVPISLDYCLEAIERGSANPPPLPVHLLSQARVAARSGVPLDVILRRYFAGYALLGDFLIDEAEATGLRRSADLKSLLRSLSAGFDRLLPAVCEEHARELSDRSVRTERRRAAQIQRLLDGEPIDVSDLAYDFEAHHVGVVAKGPGAHQALRSLAGTLDRVPLFLARGEDTVWAWLGGKRRLSPEDVRCAIGAAWPRQIRLAIGEPGSGLGGWRLTHRQATAALSIALRSSEACVRYADVALLASMLQDDLLATSLREIYLKPLEAERDGGEAMRATLRAYFASGGNVSSAAAQLGVHRGTVTSRLRTIEERLRRPIDACSAEFEAALLYQGLSGSSSS